MNLPTKFPRSLSCTLLAALLTLSARAAAQTTTPATYTVTAITISPKPVEKPALLYALLPGYAETEPGNAALKYQLAMDLYLAGHDNIVASNKNWEETLTHLREAPLADFDEAQAKTVLNYFNNPFKLLREGARMDSISWGTSMHKDGYMTLLPYLSPLRALSGILAISIRLDIKHHRWNDACDKLQTGFRMAHHMAEGETIIEVLVGNAMAAQMNNCLQDWIAEPDSPNIFWPIASLPQPFTSLRRAAQFERAITVQFPRMEIPRRRLREPRPVVELRTPLSGSQPWVHPGKLRF